MKQEWNWNDSFIIKDAITIARLASSNGKNFVSSYHPELLGEISDVMFDCPERPSDFTFSMKGVPRLYDNICLTSGGADSTIGWYYTNKPQGLYIDIGQPYTYKERTALVRLKIPYHYVDLRGTHLASKSWQHIIPGRNFLFLCIAAEMLKDYGEIMFSVVGGEGWESSKGDKSRKFIELFEEWYNQVTGKSIYVVTMNGRTKAGWLEWFVSQGHDVNIIRRDTVTCFSSSEKQCGECQACLRKFLSFMSIGIDISKDFVAHPMFGAAQYVEKYKLNLSKALVEKDFSHYSETRCVEDMNAIAQATQLMLEGRSS